MTSCRRLLAGFAALCALAVVPAASLAQGSSPAALAAATGTTGSSGVTGPSGATLLAGLSSCHSDAVPANRYAIFASQTTAASVHGTVEMSVEFVLEERSAVGGRFRAVAAPGFGEWVASAHGVGIFTYSHEVTALPAPAAFRVLVRARWIGRGHRILHRAEALSPACVQTVLAPDLAVGSIYRGAAQSGGNVTWNVVVRNQGNASAGQFQVSLSVDGTTLAPVTVPGLAAGASQVVQFSGPRCGSGGTLVASADAGNALTEPADAQRTRTVTCP
jgi:hypothetical protein